MPSPPLDPDNPSGTPKLRHASESTCSPVVPAPNPNVTADSACAETSEATLTGTGDTDLVPPTRSLNDLERGTKRLEDETAALQRHKKDLAAELESALRKLEELGWRPGPNGEWIRTWSQSMAPVYLNAGGFGEVFTYPNIAAAYKQVFNGDAASRDNLKLEFDVYIEVYAALGEVTSSDSFNSPRAWAFWDPLSMSVTRADPNPDPHPTAPQIEVWESFPRPTLHMDLIPSLHPHIGHCYRSLFFADAIRNDPEPIHLLRLYLGRTFGPETKELKQGTKSDLPLDIHRYRTLSDRLKHFCTVPPLEDVAAGMGRVLALLHWVVGIDASDIELVLGGNQQGTGVQLYVLDYNKCARWTASTPVDPASWDLSLDPGSKEFATHLSANHWKGCTLREMGVMLAKRIGFLEFYYPRPGVDLELYTIFKSAYMATVRDQLPAAAGQSRKGQMESGAGNEGAGGDPQAAALRAMEEQILDGADAFFEEWERIDDNREKKGREFKAPRVSDAFREALQWRNVRCFR